MANAKQVPAPDTRSAGPRLGLPAAVGLIATVVTAVAFEPRLSELGAPRFIERFNVLRGFGALGFGLSGAFLLAVRPRNRVGWLLFGIGAAHALSMVLAGYGLTGIHDPRGSLPGQSWAMWASEWLWAPAFWLVPTLLLLVFPSGQLPSPRWRLAAAGAVMAATLSAIGWALLPPSETDVTGMYPRGYEGPVASSSAAADLATTAGLIVGAGTVVASLVVLVRRYRRARGTERQQIEWVLVAAIATVALLVVGPFTPPPLGPLLVGVAMMPLPVAGAVAITRHRLWDIDAVFGRSLLFGALTAGALMVYGVSVWVLGGALGSSTGAPLVAIVLVALGIAPAYQRLRRIVNRLVYGARDDPSEALARLGARLEGAAAPADVLVDVAHSIGRAMRVPYVAIDEAGTPVAVWGEPVPAVESVALRHFDVEVGTLVVGTARGDRLRRSDRAALDALAPHLAVVVHAHQLSEDLERSHERLLAAHADERKRLRRELHDGLGPTLAGLALEIDRGRLLGASDPDTASRLLDALSGRIRETVKVVRAIVDDLPPPPLDELGLVGALEKVASGLAGEPVVTVDSPAGLPPLPAAVELAAYRIAAEAITNAARHAGGSRCWVTLTTKGDCLEVRVDDDGRGLPRDLHEGVGLPSMRQRAADVGGDFAINPRPDGGTSVVTALPLAFRNSE